MEAGSGLVRNWARRRRPTVASLLSLARPWRDKNVGMHHRGGDGYQFPTLDWRWLQMPLALVSRSTSYSSDCVAARRKKLMPLQERKMIDKFRLHVRGGDGGAGCTSFRKSRQSRYGLVDGGTGGRGGDVILVSSATVWDMSNLQHHLNGTRGGPGSSKKKVGSRGMDKIVQVPVGTVIHLVKGSIPSLEKVIPSENIVTWEEWEGTQSHEIKEGLDVRNMRALTQLSNEGVVGSAKSSPSQDHGNEQCRLESSTFSCHDLMLPVKPPGSDKERFLENARDAERSCLSQDDEVSISGERGDAFDAEDAIGDEEEEHGSSKRDVQSSVAEFTTAGQSIVVACGGAGGKGNAAMARGRGSEKGLPSWEHEPGNPGSEADLILELKTIADVGLVGAPNAGKSTLLGSLSMAKPATGHYKFTTLRPNIGMLEFEDFFNLTVADIPGLIEGAHENRGLGHAFLRHIERTKVLAYVVDLAGGIGDDTGPLPWDQFSELVFELEQYQKGLSKRPSIVVANKIDEEGALQALAELRKKVPFLEIYPVCAVLEEGVDSLKLGLRKLVESSQTDSVHLSQVREL